MTTNHIDQLAEWWSEAERAPFREGDVLIARFDARPMPFEIYSAACDFDTPADNVRILTRAPKPKPAWHDAVAVIAHTDKNGPQVWERCGGHWDGTAGDEALDSDLRNVTPLIEAKVTDEAMQRVFNALDPSVNWRLSMTKEDEEYVRYIVAAALGLDPA